MNDFSISNINILTTSLRLSIITREIKTLKFLCTKLCALLDRWHHMELMSLTFSFLGGSLKDVSSVGFKFAVGGHRRHLSLTAYTVRTRAVTIPIPI